MSWNAARERGLTDPRTAYQRPLQLPVGFELLDEYICKLLLVRAPDRVDISLGDEIAGVLVSVLSAGLTAVLAAVVLDRHA